MRSLTTSVILYPQGIIVGKVTRRRDPRSGKVRNVAFDSNGHRVGTFDTYREASNAVLAPYQVTPACRHCDEPVVDGRETCDRHTAPRHRPPDQSVLA